jgi:beta-fructofuranosidase
VSDAMLGPYECIGNGFLTGPKQDGLYSGRIIQGAKGDWQLMAFMGNGADGKFVGNIIDPIAIVQTHDGRLILSD